MTKVKSLLHPQVGSRELAGSSSETDVQLLYKNVLLPPVLG